MQRHQQKNYWQYFLTKKNQILAFVITQNSNLSRFRTNQALAVFKGIIAAQPCWVGHGRRRNYWLISHDVNYSDGDSSLRWCSTTNNSRVRIIFSLLHRSMNDPFSTAPAATVNEAKQSRVIEPLRAGGREEAAAQKAKINSKNINHKV